MKICSDLILGNSGCHFTILRLLMDHFAHGEHADNKMESKRPRAENKNMQIKTLLPYATLFVVNI